MIRAIDPADTERLLALAEGTGVFSASEQIALREVVDDYHAREAGNGHRAVAFVADEQVVGFAYFAPSAMSEKGWYLWWIVVSKTLQNRGIGSELLRFVEDEVRQANARVLWVETSSLPKYEPTRQFYRRHGYQVAATISDFYRDGDDQVLFVKRISGRSES